MSRGFESVFICTNRYIRSHSVNLLAPRYYDDASLDSPTEYNLSVGNGSVHIRDRLDGWIDMKSRLELT
jgi:hypothetical protein